MPIPGSWAQARRILGDGADLAVVQVRGNAAHDAVLVVGALALAEGGQLRGDVLGELAREPRELRRDAGPRRPMATGARGDAVR